MTKVFRISPRPLIVTRTYLVAKVRSLTKANMLTGNTSVQSSSGEVQIPDVSVMINSDLMIAANNYNVEILVSNCVSRSRGRKI